MSSCGCDKGSLTNTIPKTDDSLQQALKDWIEFEIAEALLETETEKIHNELEIALKAI